MLHTVSECMQKIKQLQCRIIMKNITQAVWCEDCRLEVDLQGSDLLAEPFDSRTINILNRLEVEIARFYIGSNSQFLIDQAYNQLHRQIE